uniref:Dynein regulatory complex subunit 4 n=1 Tax=Salarias fasciatus TaxID=181472 RepID=A0A672I709_SALFA
MIKMYCFVFKKHKNILKPDRCVAGGPRTSSEACSHVLSAPQLEHIVRLREELDREREERRYFQLERDRIQAFWEISKRTAEAVQAELRRRNLEKEEAEERHHVEISVYKQKLKQVLLEQQNNVTGKLNAVNTPSAVQNGHTESSLDLQRDGEAPNGVLREKKFHEMNLKELKLKHQVELMELTNEYERRIRDLEVKHHERIRSLIRTEEKRRRMEMEEVEKQMRSRVVDVKEEQERALRGAEERYSAAQTRLLTEHEQLKKQLQEAQQENKHLTESLRDAQSKLPELQTQLKQYNQNQAAATRCRARLKLVEVELKELKKEHEIMLQAFRKVQQERDELLRSQQSQVFELQQRRSLKELLLQSKLSSLTHTLQRTQQEPSVCASNTPHQPADAQPQEAAETRLDTL